MLEVCSSQGRHHKLKRGDRQQHAMRLPSVAVGEWRVGCRRGSVLAPCHFIFPSKSGSPSFICSRDRAVRERDRAAHGLGLLIHTPPMEQPDNPPEVDPEALEEALWAFANIAQESQQLAIDGVDPDDPVISAVRAMNNG